jgi:membrane-bound metal-dependent hydrolase YbcI (DUF457 family)
LPFTPFHMGAAFAIKPAARQHFSILAFGLAQIFMDLEPLMGMLNDWPRLHGWSHTVAGALLIGVATASIAIPLLPTFLRFFHRKASSPLGWLFDPCPPSRMAIWTGAMVGSLSHIVLDGLIHYDMTPLAPVSQLNPIVGWLEHDMVYGLCSILGALGAMAWVAMRWHVRRPGSQPNQRETNKTA